MSGGGISLKSTRWRMLSIQDERGLWSGGKGGGRCTCVFMHRVCHGDDIHGPQAVNKDAEKAMLAYYFRKQEEQKVSGPIQVHFCNYPHAV